jgi:hypothetical protein
MLNVPLVLSLVMAGIILFYDLMLFTLMLVKGWQICVLSVFVYGHPSILTVCVDRAARIHRTQLSLFNSVFRNGAFELSSREFILWLIVVFSGFVYYLYIFGA